MASEEYMEAYRLAQIVFDLDAKQRRALDETVYYDGIMDAMCMNDYEAARVLLHAAGIKELPNWSIAGYGRPFLVPERQKRFVSIVQEPTKVRGW